MAQNATPFPDLLQVLFRSQREQDSVGSVKPLPPPRLPDGRKESAGLPRRRGTRGGSLARSAQLGSRDMIIFKAEMVPVGQWAGRPQLPRLGGTMGNGGWKVLNCPLPGKPPVPPLATSPFHWEVVVVTAWRRPGLPSAQHRPFSFGQGAHFRQPLTHPTCQTSVL